MNKGTSVVMGLFILGLIVVLGGFALPLIGTLFEFLGMVLGGLFQGAFFLIFTGLKVVVPIGVIWFIVTKLKNKKEIN